MKKLMSLVALLTLITGFSIAEGAGPIEGNWYVQMRDNGFTMDMTFGITSSSLTLTNVCSYMGRTSRVQVSVPASYDDRTLTTLGSAEREESSNGLNCRAALSPDRMNYEVSGNTLIFSHDGSSERFVLTRR